MIKILLMTSCTWRQWLIHSATEAALRNSLFIIYHLLYALYLVNNYPFSTFTVQHTWSIIMIMLSKQKDHWQYINYTQTKQYWGYFGLSALSVQPIERNIWSLFAPNQKVKLSRMQFECLSSHWQFWERENFISPYMVNINSSKKERNNWLWGVYISFHVEYQTNACLFLHNVVAFIQA